MKAMFELLKKYDAVVIGSGASGAVMAYELANKGLKVLILEKGKWNTHKDFKHDELSMYSQLYKMSGLQTTKDNDATIAQGMTVGGSTVINNAIWIRAKLDKVLPKWDALGAHIPKSELEKNYEWLEDKLSVSDIPENMACEGTKHFLEGCKKLNIPAHLLRHNRKECLGCGWCNFACQYNRKTSMLVTFIPWAIDKGAHLLAEVSELSITYKNNIVNGVSFMHNGKPHLIESDKVVVCAGAIGSSEVLLKSRINPTGNVGKKFHVLGGFLVNALLPVKTNSFDKIGLAAIAHASDEYLIETFHSPPGVFSLTLNQWFEEHRSLMLQYPNLIQAGVMTDTKANGRISLDGKHRPVIDFKFSKEELEKLKRGLVTLSKIFFAAGATKVYPASFKPMVLNNDGETSKIDTMIKNNDDVILGSAHPQGGNIMCDDATQGVVNSRFEVHGMKNLFIADTSVWPSNIFTNCQATTMAMSKYAASLIN